MSTYAKSAGLVALVGAPLLVGALWLASGREKLTSDHKYVQVAVRDELFGGTNMEQHSVPGPIFGYYVGLLDRVAPVTVAALAIGAAWWWVARRKRRRSAPLSGGQLE